MKEKFIEKLDTINLKEALKSKELYDLYCKAYGRKDCTETRRRFVSTISIVKTVGGK
jgi:hypothetical protein